jgi:hypothetical protein
LRAPDQDHDHQAVHDERAQLGDVVLARHIGNAQQQRGQQRPRDRRGSAHGHDYEEIDHELQRESRVQPQHLGAQRPAQAGQARTERESREEHHVDVDAQARRDPLVIDRGPQAGAEAGARQHVLQGNGERGAHGDDEQPIVAHAQHQRAVADLGAAAQPAGQLHDLLGGTHEVVGRGHGHEGQADGEQHLVQVGPVVERAIQRALQHRPQQRRAGEGDGQADQEGHAEPLHQHDRDVAAGHGEGAMGQVDEIHQAHGHRQAHREDEQQHPVGDAVEEDGEHGP